MKKIIKYYANLEMNVYIFFGIQMFIYMVICYVNNVESISISMIAQVFLVSLIMCGASYLTQLYLSNTITSLIMGISIGIITFASITVIFKFEEITEVKKYIFKRK